MPTINGDHGDNVLNGTEEGDTLFGMGGNDTLNGNGSNDMLEGGPGNDTLSGGEGDDVLAGGSGDDTLNGGPGSSDRAAYGSADAGVTVDLTISGPQDTGGDGIDTLSGIESIDGSSFNDALSGDSGANQLIGGDGADILVGRGGNDIYVVDNVGDLVTEDADAGRDYVSSSVNYVLPDNVEDLGLVWAPWLTEINGTGNALNNEIAGNAGTNILSGLGGDDFLRGWEGDDTLHGGDGDDVLYGDYGFNLAGTYEFTGNDTLFGGQGNDELYGGAGTDTMHGGAGNDSYGVNEESDVVVEAPGEGRDGVQASISYTLGANVENLGIWGDDLIGIGNELDNELSASSSQPHRNTFYGMGGDDLLLGYGGDDHLDGGTGNDTLQGAEGQDTMVGGDGGDFLWALFGGADILTGGSGVDIFYGRVSELNGATITDLEVGDRIVFAGEGVESFPFDFQINGNTLTFTGGSLTLENLPPGTQLVVTPTPLPGYHYNGFAAYRYELTLVDKPARNDFNGDGRSDLLLRSSDGRITDWLGTANGGFTDNWSMVARELSNGWQVQATGDFNGDGRSDLLLRSNDGRITDWLGTAQGGFADNWSVFARDLSNDWQVEGSGDFNGDGRDDLLLRSSDGRLTDWLGTADGGFADNWSVFARDLSNDWQVEGSGDFDGDGRDDLLLRSSDGRITNWLGTADGGFTDNWSVLARSLSNDWEVQGTGDFNGDGRDDLLLRSSDGRLTNWLGTADGGFTDNWGAFARELLNDWSIEAIGDFNGDDRDDLLLRSSDGRMTDWLGTANGGFIDNWSVLAHVLSNEWRVEPDYLV